MKKTAAVIMAMLLLCSCVPNVLRVKEKLKKEVPAPKKEAVVEKTKEPREISSLDGKIIVVDPGHGLFSGGRQEAIAPGISQTKPAFVSGTSGKNQTEEQLNLAVSLKLKEALEKCGATVYMTRDTHQTERSNIDRAQFANDLGADISVKIHANGSSNTSAQGVLMLIPGNQYIKDNQLITESRKAGTYILEAVVGSTGAANCGLSVRNDMTGFNWSTVPVVLLEMGFMTNPREDALLETEEYQDKIVSGVVEGLEKYFNEQSPSGE